MATSGDDAAELVHVEQELQSIEQEIATLLMRQSYLLERKQELQESLSFVGHGEVGCGGEDEVVQDWKAEFPWSARIQTLLKEQVTSLLSCKQRGNGLLMYS